MRAVVQRVLSATVTVCPEPGREGGSAGIERGLLVFVGIERGDGPADVEYIARKIREIRVFEERATTALEPAGGRAKVGGFDRSVQEVGGQVLVVSQFTLAADCRKGRRPAFDAAAPPEVARPLYESVVLELRSAGLTVATGQFQSMMQVSLVNDGPVTLLLDSRKRL